MNPLNITAKDVFNRMVELAEQEPGFVYRGQYIEDSDGNQVEQSQCSYLGMDVESPDLGRPCIVGQALADLGFTREEIAGVEGRDAGRALGDLGLSTDLRYSSAVERAQEEQDEGKTWGEAINFARVYLDL